MGPFFMMIQSDEYGDFYGRYISKSNGNSLIDLLHENTKRASYLFDAISEKNSNFKYAEDKWTIKEVFGHLIDTERIFCYRALVLARNEEKPVAGYDHNAYIKAADFNRFTLQQLAGQYNAARIQTISLFNSFTSDELLRRGTVNEVTFTVRAIGYVIAGHEIHHRQVLEEKYLRTIELKS